MKKENESILFKKPLDTIRDFLNDYNEKCIEIKNKDFVFTEMKYYLNYIKTRKINDKSINVTSDLEVEWYKSLEKDILNPNYSVYAADHYYKEVLGCWIVYSKEYIKRLTKSISITHNKSILDILKTNIKSVVDLGNGIGYSTIALKEILPNAKVYGTNIKVSDQWAFCEYNSNKYDYIMTDDFHDIGQVDMVFASEYFEHILNPYNHLEDIVNTLNPKIMIIANSFNKKAVGHFTRYIYKGDFLDEKIAQKIFNKTMIELGYIKIKTNMWNDTPNIWIRRDISERNMY